MRPVVIPVGSTFGDWTVIGDQYRSNKMTFVPCRCVCGAERDLHAGNLRSGKSTGCGCRAGGKITARKTRHGLSDGPEHQTWQAIRKRCENPHNPSFKDYGARGIFVCDRWRESFENFLADMGPRPGPGYSIDRINNDGPYSPENCRWATKVEQNRNRRNTVRVMFNGRERTLGEVAEETGIKITVLSARYHAGRPLIP